MNMAFDSIAFFGRLQSGWVLHLRWVGLDLDRNLLSYQHGQVCDSEGHAGHANHFVDAVKIYAHPW